jgi:hypothetical protein
MKKFRSFFRNYSFLWTNRLIVFFFLFIVPVISKAQLPPPGGGTGGGGSNPDPPPVGVPMNDDLTLILLIAGLVYAVFIYRRLQRKELQKDT